MKTRSIEMQDELMLALAVTAASHRPTPFGSVTVGTGILESRATSESRHVNYECGVSLYSIGNNIYPARPDGPRQMKIRAREVNTDKLREYTCKF